MTTAPMALVSRVALRLGNLQRQRVSRRRRERIERILASADQPQPYDSEEVFRTLQDEYPPFTGYEYDPLSAWWRGVQQAHWFIPIAHIETPGARVLDAACGNGMVGRALADYGHDVVLSDLEDWRDERAGSLPFARGSLCAPLPLEPESFDAICSYNAFIHLDDPAAALENLVRLCRPGGIIYLDFGSLYPCAWGLHAYRTIRMPYPQYLFSKSFLDTKIRTLGIDAWPGDLGRSNTQLIPLNGWKLSQYQRLWHESGCEVLSHTTREDSDSLGIIERFPRAFTGRGLTYEDVVTRMVAVALRKPVREGSVSPSGAGKAATAAA